MYKSWLDFGLSGDIKTVGVSPVLMSAPLGVDNKQNYMDLPVRGGWGRAPAVVVDGGNGGLKIAVLTRTSPTRYIVRRVESTIAPYRSVISGDDVPKFSVNGSGYFRLGNPDDTDARSIRTGSTAQRMADHEYVNFLAASIVDTLEFAGWNFSVAEKQGIYLGYAIPGDEMTEDGASSETMLALKALKDRDHSVTKMIGKSGYTVDLKLVGVTVMPQTQGIFTSLYRGLSGEVVLPNLRIANIIDIGFGHTQLFRAEANGASASITGEVLGYGMINVANALQQIVKADKGKTGFNLTNVQAQHAIITGSVVAGKLIDVRHLVDQAIAKSGEEILQRTDKAFEDTKADLYVAGGGSVAMSRLINDRAKVTGRLEGTTHLIDQKVAPFAGAIGNLGYLISRLNITKPWAVNNGK